MTTTDPDLSQEVYEHEGTTATELGTTYGEQTPDSGYGPITDLDEKDGSEKRPVTHVRREPIADLVTFIWGGVGMILEQSGTDAPVGRVLQFEAPLAGRKIDELIANTWLDAILQPLAKQADKIEGLGSVIMFPLLVGAYERNPAIGPAIEPILRQVVRSTITDMAPVLRKQQSDAKKAAEAIKDMSTILDLEDGVDPVDAILSSIFRPAQPTGETASEANGSQP